MIPAHAVQAIEYLLQRARERGYTQTSWYSVAEKLGYEPYPGNYCLAYLCSAPLCNLHRSWWVLAPVMPPVPQEYYAWVDRFVASWEACEAALTLESARSQVRDVIGGNALHQRGGRYVPRIPARAVYLALEEVF